LETTSAAATTTPPPGTTSASRAPHATSATPTATRSVDPAAVSALTAGGIPVIALRAYRHAASAEDRLDSSCHLPWQLLAAIGRFESDHGRFGGAVLHTDGLSTHSIIGIALNGHCTALIRDTDGGRLDGDPVYDHSVGPMQFIPSTWGRYATDGNGD